MDKRIQSLFDELMPYGFDVVARAKRLVGERVAKLPPETRERLREGAALLATVLEAVRRDRQR